MKKLNKGYWFSAVTTSLLMAAVAHAATWDQKLADGAYQIIIGDWNGDQHSDVLWQAKRPEDEHAAIFTAVTTANTQRWKDGHLDRLWNRKDANIVVGDFNGDLNSDLLLQSITPALTSELVITEATGNIGVPTQAIGDWHLGLRWDDSSSKLIVGDFDGDGRDDIFLHGKDKNRHGLALTDENGQFQKLAFDFDNYQHNLDWSEKNTTLNVGDFNGDGKYELLLQPSQSDGQVSQIGGSYEQGPLAAITQQWSAQHLGLDWSSRRHRLVVGDFNGDGKDDVFLLATTKVDASAYLPSNGTGFASIQEQIDSIPNIEKLKDILVADFDADSIDELLLVFDDKNSPLMLLLADNARRARLEGLFKQNGLLVNNQTLGWLASTAATASANTIETDVSAAAIAQCSPTDPNCEPEPDLCDLNPELPECNVVPPPIQDDTEALKWNEYGGSGGQFRVNESGAATYDFPIMAAPGSGGLSPKISLNYNSQGGNGSLGMGWAISGLSSVSRCRATKETEGFDGSINFDDNDKFCLDGQKLINSSAGASAASIATCPSGQTQLRVLVTEIYSGSLVLACGQRSGSGSQTEQVQSFIVVSKDGTTRYYGNFNGNYSQATIELNDALAGIATTKTMTWVLARIKDSAKNYISFEYNKNIVEGTHTIAKILYTGNEGNGQLPYAYLQFNYEARHDARTSYAFGSKSNLNTRLQSIDSYSESVHQRRYKFFYGVPALAPVSQLEFIKECRTVAGTETCLPPLKFTWQRAAKDYATSAYPRQGGFSARYVLHNTKFGDLNGDGRQDMVWMREYNQGNDRDWRTWISTPQSDGSYKLIETGTTNLYADRAYKGNWFFVDYNGDGRQDILHGDGSYWKIVLTFPDGGLDPTSVSTTSIPRHDGDNSQLVDIDSDGIRDLLQVSGDGNNVYISYGYKPPGQSVYGFEPEILAGTLSYPSVPDGWKRTTGDSINVADLNGDGLLDLVSLTKYIVPGARGSFKIYRKPVYYVSSKGSGRTINFVRTEYPQLAGIGSSYSTDYSKFRLADLNSDGITDVIGVTSNDADAKTYDVYFGTGNGFKKVHSYYGWRSLDRIQLVDLNSDGLTDLIWAGNGRYWISYQNPDGSFKNETLSTLSYDVDADSEDLFADVTGDGFSDQIHIDIDDYVRIHPIGDQYIARNVIKTITSISTDATTHIEYKSLVNGPYVRANNGVALSNYWGTSYIYDITGPMYLVSSAKSSAPGINATGSYDPNYMAELRYSYTGLRMQAGGRGSLGFETLKTQEMQSGVITETTFSQKFPFIGMPEKTVKKTASGVQIHRANNVLLTKDAALGGKIPYFRTSEELTYDIDSGNTLLSDVYTTTEVDGYNNSTKVTVRQKVATPFDYLTTTTTSDFGSSATDPFFGRLKSSTVKKESPTGSRTRNTEFTYDPLSRHLVNEILMPLGNNRENLKTVHAYDAFGNRIKSTICSKHIVTCGSDTTRTDNDALVINRSSTVEFDSKGRFVKWKKNHFGQKTEDVIERTAANLYQPTEIKGATGVIKSLQYTVMGRLSYESDSTGAWRRIALYPVTDTSDGIAAATGAVYKQSITSAAYPTGFGELTEYDLLGRGIRSISRLGKKLVKKDNAYDTLGRVKRTSTPYFDGATPYWTDYGYDVLNRAKLVTSPNGAVVETTRSGLSNTILTMAFDYGSSTRIEHRNLLGQLERVTDNNGKTVTYTYDVEGNLLTMSRVGRNEKQSELIYDEMGRKKFMWDADKSPGSSTTTGWHYEYNALGELTKQTDARGYTTENFYDPAGRMLRRVERNNTGTELSNTTWKFDELSNQSSDATQLKEERDGVSNYKRAFDYDVLGRAKKTTYTFDTYSLEDGVEYDTIGRVWKSKDVTGQTVETVYVDGLTAQLRDANNIATIFQTIDERDAWGNVKQETAGNGVVTVRVYDEAMGWLRFIGSNRGGVAIQKLNYTWNQLGIWKQRVDTSSGKYLSETFEYDGLDRLTQVTATGSGINETVTVAYDDEGNIKRKTDFSSAVDSYKYGTDCAGNAVVAGPHAASCVNGVNYNYDKNGNQLSGNGRTLTYNTAFDLPTQIAGSNGAKTEYVYAPSRGRYKRVDTTGTTKTTTYFVGGVEIISKANSKVEFRRYVGNAIINNGRISYVHKDHLGSTDVITDCYGNIDQRFSFDAWGKQRQLSGTMLSSQAWRDWRTQPFGLRLLSPQSNAKTIHGFTGHEQIDELGLIHMNGRVYDPFMARFLQADPVIQSPSNSQSLNRYSYVLNNPLSLTDPSGFYSKLVHPMRAMMSNWSYEHGQQFTGLASMGCGAWYAACVAAGNYDNARAHGVERSQAFDAAMNAGVMAFMSQMAFQAVGSAFESAGAGDTGTFAGTDMSPGWYAAKVGAHAMVGGTMSYIQGGKFGDGAISAGVTQAFSGAIDHAATGDSGGAVATRVAVAALVGGTASSLSGGKFANGAISGAMSRMFNDESEENEVVSDESGLNYFYDPTEFKYAAGFSEEGVLTAKGHGFPGGYFNGKARQMWWLDKMEGDIAKWLNAHPNTKTIRFALCHSAVDGENTPSIAKYFAQKYPHLRIEGTSGNVVWMEKTKVPELWSGKSYDAAERRYVGGGTLLNWELVKP